MHRSTELSCGMHLVCLCAAHAHALQHRDDFSEGSHVSIEMPRRMPCSANTIHGMHLAQLSGAEAHALEQR